MLLARRYHGIMRNILLSILWSECLAPACASDSQLVRRRAMFTWSCLNSNLTADSVIRYCINCADPTAPNRVAVNELLEKHHLTSIRQLVPRLLDTVAQGGSGNAGEV